MWWTQFVPIFFTFPAISAPSDNSEYAVVLVSDQWAAPSYSWEYPVGKFQSTPPRVVLANARAHTLCPETIRILCCSFCWISIQWHPVTIEISLVTMCIDPVSQHTPLIRWPGPGDQVKDKEENNSEENNNKNNHDNSKNISLLPHCHNIVDQETPGGEMQTTTMQTTTIQTTTIQTTTTQTRTRKKTARTFLVWTRWTHACF